MNIIILALGISGFLICLILMYGTNHGIPGIQKYDPNFRLLDMRFRYNGDAIYNTFDKIGSQGVQAYKHFLLLDFCFIASFLIVMIAITLRITSQTTYRNILLGLAVARAALDILENILLITLANNYPIRNDFLANICSWSTTLKFIALYAWVISVIGILIIRFWP